MRVTARNKALCKVVLVRDQLLRSLIHTYLVVLMTSDNLAIINLSCHNTSCCELIFTDLLIWLVLNFTLNGGVDRVNAIIYFRARQSIL